MSMLCAISAARLSTPVMSVSRIESAATESLVDGLPAVESLNWEGRQLMYGYTLINSLLPGADRLKYKGVSSLFDLRIRGGKTEYRLYDRALRNRHSGDAPFALESFAKGSSVYSIDGDRLVEREQ